MANEKQKLFFRNRWFVWALVFALTSAVLLTTYIRYTEVQDDQSIITLI